VIDRQVRGRHGRAGSKLLFLSLIPVCFHIVSIARVVYRRGRCPFKAERGVRFPFRVPYENTLPISSGVPVGLVGVLQASVF
jgi:hypothetical protein